MEYLKRKLNIARAKRWNGYYRSMMPKRPIKKWSLQDVEKVVCSYFHIDSYILQNPTRKTEVVKYRQVAMFFSKRLCKHETLTIIGSYFGGKDHATVLSSCKTVSNMYDTDSIYRAQIDELTMIFKMQL